MSRTSENQEKSFFSSSSQFHVSYVSVIAVDSDADEVLLLRKLKGPAHLIGKQTFPGGKVELTDASKAHAAAREVFEEAGLVVRPQNLFHLMSKGNTQFSLDVFVSVGSLAGTGPQAHEQEQVYRACWSKTKQDILGGCDDFASDTAYMLRSMQEVPALRSLFWLKPELPDSPELGARSMPGIKRSRF